VLNFAQTLTFKDKHPVVTLVEKVYLTGVKLTHLAMEEVEKHIDIATMRKRRMITPMFSIRHRGRLPV
jgi:hypothetical protein